MRIGRNLAAGLASSIWTALIGLAVIPLYVRYLGKEGYGLIGFLATAQALVQILDLGLSTSVNREIARESEAGGGWSHAPALLRTVATIYWVIAAGIALAVLALAHFIANHWLHAEGMASGDVVLAVALMGVVIACRWPAQLYQSVLMGAQRIVLASVLNIATVTLASGAVVFVLAFVSPSVAAFLLWQACVYLAYTLAARAMGWRVIGREGARLDRNELKRIWRFSAGVTAITICGIVLGQLDKLVLSKMLSLSEYGQYMIAFALAGTLYLFTLPLFNAVYPRFSGLVQSRDAAGLSHIYRLSTRLLSTILFPIAMLLSVFPEELIRAWTGDRGLAEAVGPLVPILAAGTALHGLMYVPFALQLAHGTTRLPLTIYAVLLAIATPLTVVLVFSYGALGGALAWLTLHSLYLVLGTWMTRRQLLKELDLRWLALDICLPVATSTLAGLFARALSAAGELGLYARLACGAGWALVAFVVAFMASPELRNAALRMARGAAFRIL